MPEVNNIPPSLSYRPAGPAEPVMDMSIGDALRAATSTWRTRTALVDGTSEEQTRRRWTFEELLTESEKVARALLLRFVSGEHVAIWAANGPQWVMIELGAALAGLTLVTVNPAYLGEELAFVLRQSRARGIIVQDVYRNRNLVQAVNAARDWFIRKKLNPKSPPWDDVHARCRRLLSGEQRTSHFKRAMSVNDPQQTLGARLPFEPRRPKRKLAERTYINFLSR